MHARWLFTLLGSSLIACSDAALTLRWRVAFESADLSEDAAAVHVTIVRGGCAGDEIVWEDTYQAAHTASREGKLKRGRYGLRGRALTETCSIYAFGCENVDVPTREAVTVTLVETAPSQACAESECTRGLCAASSDAGAPDADSTGGPGACLYVVDGAVVECELRDRNSCPVLPTLDQVFYGEGSWCPSPEHLYAWNGEDCNADVDGNGLVNLSDVATVTECQGQDPSGCEPSDVNFDGRVDDWDVCIVQTAFSSPTDCHAPSCGACLTDRTGRLCSVRDPSHCDQVHVLERCPECVCDTDLDRDGITTVFDLRTVVDCVLGASDNCSLADVNCDGAIDDCDTEAVTCTLEELADCCLRACEPSPTE